MELTYRVRGADGKEYGPVLLEQLVAWVQQGRLPPQQPVKRSDMDYWVSASEFIELQPAYGIVPAEETAAGAAGAAAADATQPAGKSNRWLYWVLIGLCLLGVAGYFLWRQVG